VTGTGFSLSGVSLPLTLTAGQSATINVNFTLLRVGLIAALFPGKHRFNGETGNHNGKRSNLASTNIITRSRTGLGLWMAPGQLSVAPSSIDLGNVQLGSSRTQSTTVDQLRRHERHYQSGCSHRAGFNVSGLSVPVTLTPGQSATFNATSRHSPVEVQRQRSIAAMLRTLPSPSLLRDRSHPRIAERKPGEPQFRQRSGGNSQPLQETVTNSGGSSSHYASAGDRCGLQHERHEPARDFDAGPECDFQRDLRAQSAEVPAATFRLQQCFERYPHRPSPGPESPPDR